MEVLGNLHRVDFVDGWDRVRSLFAAESADAEDGQVVGPVRLDREGLADGGRDAASYHASYLVDVAKAEALQLHGEREAAEGILAKPMRR